MFFVGNCALMEHSCAAMERADWSASCTTPGRCITEKTMNGCQRGEFTHVHGQKVLATQSNGTFQAGKTYCEGYGALTRNTVALFLDLIVAVGIIVCAHMSNQIGLPYLAEKIFKWAGGMYLFCVAIGLLFAACAPRCQTYAPAVARGDQEPFCNCSCAASCIKIMPVFSCCPGCP